MHFVPTDMPDHLASRRPLFYSGLLTFTFITAIVIIALVGSATHSKEGIEISGALGRGLVAGLALMALASTPDARWLAAPSGLGWAAATVVLAYILVVFPPLFSGRYAVPIGRLPMYVALDGFAAGVAEEAVFRGLILGALCRAYTVRPTGRQRAILLSSAFFSVPHALNVLAGADPRRTLAQLVWAFLLGLVFAVLVLVGDSLWGAVLVHGFSNAYVHVNRLNASGETSTLRALLLALAALPLVVSGAWLLRRLSPPADGPTPS